ncbi:MAG: hypothetical protein QOE90_1880 [Thermoplasmata archaeon]|nr:hypothetical protein [Thermoplasmata archaeon]
MNRVLLYAGVAFVAGALVGAALVFPGGPLSAAAPTQVIFVHVENAGGSEVQANVAIFDSSGASIAASSFKVPAHSSVEKTVVNLKAARYEVRATFSINGAAASGRVGLDTRACGQDGFAMATFAVDGTNGITMRDAGSASCRA